MNMASPRTYDDALIVAAAETLGCVAYLYARPLLVLVGGATVLLLVKRLRDEPESSNVILVRHLALMVFLSWSGWMLWSLSLGPLQLPRRFVWAYSACSIGLGHYCVSYEFANFNARNNRAAVMAGLVFLAGLVPVNSAVDMQPALLLAQSLAHCSCAFALFFLRVRLKHINTIPALFAYSFWALTTYYPLALLAAAGDLALTAMTWAREEPPVADIEAPPPLPKRVPPPNDDGPRLTLLRGL